MSKSLGNVIDPCSLLRSGPPQYFKPQSCAVVLSSAPAINAPDVEVPWLTPDALRYFLAREGSCAMRGGDADFSPAALHMRVVSEAADALGNLASRLLSGPLLPEGRVPYADLCDAERLREQSVAFEVGAAGDASQLADASGIDGPTLIELQLVRALCSLRDVCGPAYAVGDPSTAMETIVETLSLANRAFTEAAPWAISKRLPAMTTQPERQLAAARLARCLYLALESLRVVGSVLAPVIPLASATLLRALGVVPAPSHSPSLGADDDDGDERAVCAAVPGMSPLAPAAVAGRWHGAIFGVLRPGEYALPLPSEGTPLVLFPKPPSGREKRATLKR